jgi:hypothetical protein
MQRQITRRGPTKFAMNVKKSYPFPHYMIDPSISKHESEMQALKQYGQQFYLGSGYDFANAQSRSGYEFSQAQVRGDTYRYLPQFFDDLFMSRVQHFQETQTERINEPCKYEAQQKLLKGLRFADMFIYSDTIAPDFELIRDTKEFFMIM